MNISFIDFWDGFIYENNFFIDLLKSMNRNYNLIPFSDETDILIYSCFGERHKTANRNKVKKIFYTGENVRPNYNDCDYSLTFDFDTYSHKNIRLPLWLLQLDWFNKKNYGNPQFVIPLQEIAYNKWAQKQKTQFCSIVFNNPSPYRIEIIQKLSKYKPVHCYGRVTNNSIPYGEDTKCELISNYKFNICFENSIHPGYYTEKLIHAKISGCLPLYWADNNCEKDFNPNSFLNLYNFNSINEFVDKVIWLDNNQEEYNKICDEYLFKDKVLSLDNIKQQITNIL
jgi:hypothetical protein